MNGQDAPRRQTAAKRSGPPKDEMTLSPEAALRALQELRVHQAELEMQNESLRLMQVKLAAARERYFELYDLAPDGYCTLSITGVLIEANLAATKLLGINRPALSMQSFFTSFILNDDRDVFYLYRKQLLDTDLPQDFELRMLKNGSTPFWAQLKMVAAKDADGAATINVMISDISKNKLMEAGLREAKAAAERASMAKSDFLASMSHELRTPLNPVLGFAELLAGASNLTKEQRNWVEIIIRRGKDLLGLVGSVLDLSKIEAEKLVLIQQPLELRAMVQDMIASIIPAAGKKGLLLELEVSPDVPEECLADDLRLRQILLNLLDNAIKFTVAGGVTVCLQNELAARFGRPTAADEAGLLFSIHDTGVGIPADRQAAIFEAFTQADAKHAVNYGGGTGLGLTIAQRLVELMGGKIWVESVAGQGSTFFFTVIVGIIRSSAASREAAPQTNCSAAGKLLKILVVDDDPASRLVAESMLQKFGHTVRAVQDGKQALACLAEEPFDVVLMDVQMPGMDGIEATKSIRKVDLRCRSGRLPVIAVTSFVGVGDRERFLAAGMDGYVSKPVSMDSLADAIARIAMPD